VCNAAQKWDPAAGGGRQEKSTVAANLPSLFALKAPVLIATAIAKRSA
jgi:hypothetical protein